MVKTKFKKAVSLMLAAVMSLTAFTGIGATTAFAAVGEKADVYLVDYPRSGDTNNNGEWGHGNLNYMNGWKGFLQFAGSLLNLRQVTVQNPFRQKIVVQDFVMFLQISSPHLRPSAESHFRLLRQFQVRKIVISHHRVCDFAHRFDSFRL